MVQCHEFGVQHRKRDDQMNRYNGVEYPVLRGKTIKQVRFIEDSEFTAIDYGIRG